MTDSFSVLEALRFGWRITREHSGLLFKAMLALFALQVFSAITDKVLSGTALGGLAQFAVTVISVFLGAGFMLIALKLAEGKHAHIGDLLPEGRLVWRFFCADVLSYILVLLPMLAAAAVVLVQLVSAIGPDRIEIMMTSVSADPKTAQDALLFVLTQINAVSVFAAVIGFVASAYLALRYFLVRFAILDGARITESLKRSAALTYGVKWHLLLFLLTLILINIIGAALLFVGLLVTVPVSTIAYAHVYLKLKHGRAR